MQTKISFFFISRYTQPTYQAAQPAPAPAPAPASVYQTSPAQSTNPLFSSFQSRFLKFDQPASTQPAYQPAYQQAYQAQPAYQPQPAYQQPAYQQPAYQQSAYQPSFRPATRFGFDSSPQPSYYSPPSYSNYNHNPASNVDIWTGSYSVNYKRR